MKNNLLLLLSIVLFTSCYQPIYRDQLLEKQVLPTYPHLKKVKVYWPKDSVKAITNSIFVNKFEIEAHPHSNTKELTDSLQSFGRKLGYDFLMIEKSDITGWEDIEHSPSKTIVYLSTKIDNQGPNNTFKSKVLQVNAFKYLANIDYAEELLYSKRTLSKIDDGDQKLVFEEYFNPSGSLLFKNGSKSMEWTLRNYSEKYFIEDNSEDWQFRWSENQTLFRKNEKVKVKARFALNRPVEIFVHQQNRSNKKYSISLFYDESGRLKEKVIMRNGQVFAKVDVFSDHRHRTIREELSFVGESRQLITYFSYYDKKRLKQRIAIDSKEQIVNQP